MGRPVILKFLGANWRLRAQLINFGIQFPQLSVELHFAVELYFFVQTRLQLALLALQAA
ncbi:hypothetical protein D3C86_2122170 [compost metagenome]